MIRSSNERPLAFRRERLPVSGTARHATRFKPHRPGAITNGSSNPAAMSLNHGKGCGVGGPIRNRGPGLRTATQSLLTSLGFDRNGLALLPLPKASITGTLCPLEWRRRRKHQRWRPIGVDSGGVQAWLDARASATGLTSHSARRPGQITQRVHTGDACTLV